MTTSAVNISAEPSWSRRESIESILSIQGKETGLVNRRTDMPRPIFLKLDVFIDFVRDSSDTDAFEDEFEPCTESEGEALSVANSSGESDNEIISTKVIEVCVNDEGDLEFADSEQTATDGSDSELDLCDFWRCAQCGGRNETPLYTYCRKCFQVRKNLFPPRPKRKTKRKKRDDTRPPLSQDSGIESQEIHDPNLAGPNQSDPIAHSSQQSIETSKSVLTPDSGTTEDRLHDSNTERYQIPRKRRASSVDRDGKKTRFESETDSDNETKSVEVAPLIKTISDPALSVEEVKVTKKVISETLKEIDKDNNMCIVCLNEPKSGVFVHGRIAHICCCYKCALKVWAKAKRCPVCNCKVSNVLKAVVM